jgi:hypothetical protein
VAVIVSEPIGSAVLLTVATPFIKADVPRMVEPLVKITAPVALDGTDAVKTTAWFAADGLIDDESVSAGDAFATVCVTDPVAGLLTLSPL